MTDWCVGVIHGGGTMHKGRRTERRFTGITEIEIRTEIVIEFPREAEREFVEEIVWMLPVMQWLAVPRFATLKEKRITASLFGERIQTHHQTRTELGRVGERMGIHCHEPIRRIDLIDAAPRAYVRLTRETRAVQHEHVLAEHEHASVHRRRIRQPACAGAFAVHWIGKVD